MFATLIEKIKILDARNVKELAGTLSTGEFNTLDEDGRTALHIVVQTLLEEERNSSKEMKQNISQLNLYYKNAKTIIDILICKMSDWAINLTDKEGFTALNYASLTNISEISWAILGKTPACIKSEHAFESAENNDYYHVNHTGDIIEHA